MELTVISGKGGTGKTTIAMGIAQLSRASMLADCDVDAPNLYLYHKGEDIQKEPFYALKKAKIYKKQCIDCGACQAVCVFEAIQNCVVNPYHCEGCGACRLVCPSGAIDLFDHKSADVYITKLDKGYISRSEMEVGSDGSGKLVTMLRKNALAYSKDLIVVDGSPGIGCSVISSITASDLVLIVTEPSQSGFADFKRVAALCAHFAIPTLVCINKFDINMVIVDQIERYCVSEDIDIFGMIPYDTTVMDSINELKPITAYANSPANIAIRQMWAKIDAFIAGNKENISEDKK